MNVIGISAFYHDSAAALIRDGRIIAAAEEERFTRIKHDASFPVSALRYVLEAGGISRDEIDLAVYYEKPLTHFIRILRTHLATAPFSWSSFAQAIPVWVRKKLWVSYWIEKHCLDLGFDAPKRIAYAEHHQSHAASAFFPSPFDKAAILTIDGVGEWATTTIAHGEGKEIRLWAETRFPHSLGLLYSAFTHYCGFRVNSGEYKLMGLAPYGKPRYADRIKATLVELRSDGSFRLDLRYFDYLGGLTMTSRRFDELFDGPARKPEEAITERYADVAASIQRVLEEAVCNLAKAAVIATGSRNLCMAGGVALNCVANGRLLREGIVDHLWIQPAAGDSGGAVGAALLGWYGTSGASRVADAPDAMHGALLGPHFTDDQIRDSLVRQGAAYERLDGGEWPDRLAGLIAEGKVVGIFRGRMEFGPRALGNRSIVGDPRSETMQSLMNLKIKLRESFRPFAPAVLREHAAEWFDLRCDSPYMLLVADVNVAHRYPAPDLEAFDLAARLRQVRSTIPAVTHIDGSARLQTVDRNVCPDFHALLEAFYRLTGVPVLINTSFNVRGEPIVCTPDDAYRCFMKTGMDYLLLGSFLLDRQQQPALHDDLQWRDRLLLD